MSRLIANLTANTRLIADMGGVYGGPPVIIRDGNTFAWYLSDFLDTITKDGANRVSEWRDFLDSGRDLLQATDQPLWSANGILFDGVSEFMKTLPFVLNQPTQIYIVFRQISWTNIDKIIDGNTSNSGGLQQRSASPKFSADAGIFSAAVPLVLNTFGIVRILFNRATSTLQVNEIVQIIGNWGAANMSGFTVGARGDGLGAFSNIEVKEVILRNVIDTAPNQTIIYNYLKDKYSI